MCVDEYCMWLHRLFERLSVYHEEHCPKRGCLWKGYVWRDLNNCSYDAEAFGDGEGSITDARGKWRKAKACMRAAIRMQSFVRGGIARKTAKERRGAAIDIGRHAKGKVARKKSRETDGLWRPAGIEYIFGRYPGFGSGNWLSDVDEASSPYEMLPPSELRVWDPNERASLGSPIRRRDVGRRDVQEVTEDGISSTTWHSPFRKAYLTNDSPSDPLQFDAKEEPNPRDYLFRSFDHKRITRSTSLASARLTDVTPRSARAPPALYLARSSSLPALLLSPLPPSKGKGKAKKLRPTEARPCACSAEYSPALRRFVTAPDFVTRRSMLPPLSEGDATKPQDQVDPPPASSTIAAPPAALTPWSRATTPGGAGLGSMVAGIGAGVGADIGASQLKSFLAGI